MRYSMSMRYCMAKKTNQPVSMLRGPGVLQEAREGAHERLGGHQRERGGGGKRSEDLHQGWRSSGTMWRWREDIFWPL